MQLRRLAQWQRRRHELATGYDVRLAGIPGLGLPHRPMAGVGEHSWQSYSVRIERPAFERDGVVRALAAAGIGTTYLTPPLHQLAYCRGVSELPDTGHPGADRFTDQLISLPLYPRLTETAIDRVGEVLEATLGQSHVRPPRATRQPVSGSLIAVTSVPLPLRRGRQSDTLVTRGGCGPWSRGSRPEPTLGEVRMAQHHRSKTSSGWRLVSAVVGCLLLALLSSCGGNGDKTGVSLIIKTQTNPYFVSMKQAAQVEAKKTGTHLSVAAGNADGDTQSQINAIDTAIARGDKGILITSNGPAVNAALRQAKDYGLFVVALDTPLDPVKTADITYATDNFQAGKLIGEYAAARLAGKKAVIAMLDLYDDQVVSVDIDRDHGFLTGMGIDPGSKTLNAKEERSGTYKGGKGGSYEIACHQATQGAVDGGRKAMEQCLSRNPDINVVYTINEPAGEGALRRPEGRQPRGQDVHRLHRRQLPGHGGRRERHLRRRRDAVPREDGAARRQRGREDRRGRAAAGAAGGRGLPRHRDPARHGQADGRHQEPDGRRRTQDVLGHSR